MLGRPEHKENAHPFAIMLAPRLLAERGVLIIGGGQVAARKVRDILAVGGRVTLIAPDIAPEISYLAAAHPGTLTLLVREYHTGDVDSSKAILCIAATAQRAVNAAIAEEAHAVGRLVNVVDDIQQCDFIVPGVLYRGEISVAVSTGSFTGDEAGASPALAAHVRDRIAAAIGPEYGDMARLMRQFRPVIKARVPAAERARLWREIVQSDALHLLRDGDSAGAETLIGRMIDARANPEV